MHKRSTQNPARRAITMTLLMGPAIAFAQTVPDAGRLLEQNKVPQLIAPTVSPGKVLPDVAPLATPPAAGAERVLVSQFAFEGVSAFPVATLQALLAPYTGLALSFTEMNQAAATVSQYYRDRGYFLASAYLPAQDLTRGLVRLQVLEGRVSDVKVVPDAGVRLHPDVARRYLDDLVKVGQPVREDALERALLLTQDLPGIGARAELGPGAALGDTAVAVALTEGPLVTGNVGLDNSSNRYTGQMRATGGVNLNDLGGTGAQASLQVATTGDKFNYARAGLVAPVGAAGTKLGVAYSRLRYKLGGDFAALEASGSAGVAQVMLVHPLVRSRNQSVQLRAGYEDKRYVNEANGSETGNKTVRAVPLGLSMNWLDQMGGGGSSSAAVELAAGKVDLSRNAAALAADRAGPDSDGNFARTSYQFSRFQRVSAAGALLFKFGGQVASTNLEAGEKMSLGGPDKVRAYAAGEASGDDGQVLALEGRYSVPAIRSELSVFYDYGHIRLNHNLYPGALVAGGPGNTYSLQGVGAGIQWSGPWRTSVLVQVATRVGDNPGRSAAGKDVDGRSSRTRAWLQVSSYF